jgi:lycopene beta-cyclase
MELVRHARVDCNRRAVCCVPTDEEAAAMPVHTSAPETAASRASQRAPYVILGGGLAGGLTALALCDAGRGKSVVIVERDARLGGNHTWSFHDTDLDDAERRLVSALVTHRWPRHLVRFPGRTRTIEAGYSTFLGADLERVVGERVRGAGGQVMVNATAAAIDTRGVRLDDGRLLGAAVVLDARGPGAPSSAEGSGFQKFVGLELELTSDGPWTIPVVMDATVPQLGGYRFVYVLPFTRRRILVEDTVYSSDGHLDIADAESRVWDYVQGNGVAVQRIVRREIGVLPLPLRETRPPGSQATATPPDAIPVVAIGYRGGLFHPVTGYSLPLAARVATAIARAPSAAGVPAAVAAVTRAVRGQARFQRLLNRLLFQAMPAGERWHALDRFYRLPDATIARFYASRNTMWDRVRVLAGRPPRGVSLSRLLRLRPEEA